MKKYRWMAFMLAVVAAFDVWAWRDLETGTFLTRDPIGYEDGPNVYCYVHCNPITKFDALGLWEKDVHFGSKKYGGTLQWAQKAGFAEKQAKIIAKTCDKVDSGRTGPLPLIGDQSRHFNINSKGERDSRLEHAKTHFDKAVTLQKKADQKRKGNIFQRLTASATEKKGLKELGKGLHSLQDISAHTPEVTSKEFGVYHHLGSEKARKTDIPEENKVGFDRVQKNTEKYLNDFKDATKKPASESSSMDKSAQSLTPSSGTDKLEVKKEEYR